MSERARFLVIRFSSIGDIVLTTPVIRALREQIHPSPEIHFLTKKSYAAVVANNPYIDAVHTIDKTTAELTEVLRELEFHYIIDLHSNIRSRMVKKRLNALAFTLDKQNFSKWMLVNFGAHRGKIRHIVDRNLETVALFSVEDDGKGLDFFISPSADEEVRSVAPHLPEQYTAIALGATHAGKRMSTGFIQRVVETSQHHFILLGGKEDVDAGAALEHLPNVTNLAGKLSLHGSAEVIRRSQQVISGDTGLMHIASALKKRVLSVWGCTSPELGMSPWQPADGSVVIQPLNRNKRPCSKLGDRCKYGNANRCIDAVDPADVVRALTPEA